MGFRKYPYFHSGTGPTEFVGKKTVASTDFVKAISGLNGCCFSWYRSLHSMDLAFDIFINSTTPITRSTRKFKHPTISTNFKTAQIPAPDSSGMPKVVRKYTNPQTEHMHVKQLQIGLFKYSKIGCVVYWSIQLVNGERIFPGKQAA